MPPFTISLLLLLISSLSLVVAFFFSSPWNCQFKPPACVSTFLRSFLWAEHICVALCTISFLWSRFMGREDYVCSTFNVDMWTDFMVIFLTAFAIKTICFAFSSLNNWFSVIVVGVVVKRVRWGSGAIYVTAFILCLIKVNPSPSSKPLLPDNRAWW